MIDMTTPLDDELVETVRTQLRQNRIGRVVAVRLQAYLPIPAADTRTATEALLHKISAWFESPVARVDEQPAGARHLTLLATYQDGETAFVSCTAEVEAVDYDLLVIGTHGTIRFE